MNEHCYIVGRWMEVECLGVEVRWPGYLSIFLFCFKGTYGWSEVWSELEVEEIRLLGSSMIIVGVGGDEFFGLEE